MNVGSKKLRHGLRTLHKDWDIETCSDIEPIRSRWQAVERSGVCTPFQSFAWVSAILRSFEWLEPHIIIVKDRHSGEDVLLLPIVRRRAQLVRFLEVPDFGVNDYNAPIIARSISADLSRVAEVWQAAMSVLPAGDVLHLRKVPEVLSDTPNPLLGLQGFRSECYSSWQLTLPETLTEYEQKTLSAPNRKQVRRRTRQLEAAGDLQYFVPNTDAERKLLFDVLTQQRQSRFTALGRYNILASRIHRPFYDGIISTGFDPNVLTLHALKMDGEIVAAAFGLYWQKRFYLLMSTMSSGKWLEMSPGIVMITKLIAHMHARGCRAFDFTIGDEPYKRQLGATEGAIFEYCRVQSPIGGPYVLGVKLWPTIVAMKRQLTKTADGYIANRGRRREVHSEEAQHDTNTPANQSRVRLLSR